MKRRENTQIALAGSRRRLYRRCVARAGEMMPNREKISKTIRKARRIFERLQNLPRCKGLSRNICDFCDLLSDYFDGVYPNLPLSTIVAVLGGLLFLIRWPVINLMGVESAYTAALTASILAFYCCWCPLRQLNYVLVVGILRAGGDTRISALLDVGVTLCWGAPICWALAYVFHLPFLWIVCGTFIAEDILKLPLCLLRMKSGKWLHTLTVE